MYRKEWINQHVYRGSRLCGKVCGNQLSTDRPKLIAHLKINMYTFLPHSCMIIVKATQPQRDNFINISMIRFSDSHASPPPLHPSYKDNVQSRPLVLKHHTNETALKNDAKLGLLGFTTVFHLFNQMVPFHFSWCITLDCDCTYIFCSLID